MNGIWNTFGIWSVEHWSSAIADHPLPRRYLWVCRITNKAKITFFFMLELQAADMLSFFHTHLETFSPWRFCTCSDQIHAARLLNVLAASSYFIATFSLWLSLKNRVNIGIVAFHNSVPLSLLSLLLILPRSIRLKYCFSFLSLLCSPYLSRGPFKCCRITFLSDVTINSFSALDSSGYITPQPLKAMLTSQHCLLGYVKSSKMTYCHVLPATLVFPGLPSTFQLALHWTLCLNAANIYFLVWKYELARTDNDSPVSGNGTDKIHQEGLTHSMFVHM